MIDTARPTLRTRPLLGLLVGCACLLVAVLAVEYHSSVKRELRLASSSSFAAIRGVPADRQTAPALASQRQPAADHTGDWTRTALARPLFSPSRRPVATVVSGPREPRLAGIVLAPSGAKAIFAGDGDARGIVAGVGQQAGSWRVLAIAVDGVRVIGPDGLRTLHPSRDAAQHDGDGGLASAPTLGPHPSILDLLRSRPLQLGPFNGVPPLPAGLRGSPPAPSP